MKDPRDVLKRPVITERSADLMTEKKYTFEVDVRANKTEMKDPRDVLKRLLGNGKLEKKLTVKANKFSASAKEAVEAAGGTAEVI